MEAVHIRDDYIRLGQAMKLSNLVSSGVEAKIAIQSGEVSVNGEVELRRGRKLHSSDFFEYAGKKITVVGE